jgi:hypothetical protein
MGRSQPDHAPDSPSGRAVIDSASRKMCLTCGNRSRTALSIRSTAFSSSCDDNPGRNWKHGRAAGDGGGDELDGSNGEAAENVSHDDRC